MIYKNISKLYKLFESKVFIFALIHHKVLAGSEHECVLDTSLKTIVDIGANKGQFSLAALHYSPLANIYAFEPLPSASKTFKQIFSKYKRVKLFDSAIGPTSSKINIHISGRDDSSSLLPISQKQVDFFPGTASIGRLEVSIGPLSNFINIDEIESPALLKLDVQGFEYSALVGCDSRINCFDWIYCECSFIEFYEGQKLAHEIIEYLMLRRFNLAGIYNTTLNADGAVVQADFLFKKT